MDLDKVLSIQVDDPIPFMQLLAKSDSGITEVREQKLMMIFQVFLSSQILLVIIDHGPQTDASCERFARLPDLPAATFRDEFRSVFASLFYRISLHLLYPKRLVLSVERRKKNL